MAKKSVDAPTKVSKHASEKATTDVKAGGPSVDDAVILSA